LDFDHVAQMAGVRVLQGRFGGAVNVATIEALVAAAIEILGRIVRLRVN
jgi:hypothetical protein